MKYSEKRKHLISKTLVVLLLFGALFFALCDCTPQIQTKETVVTFERN